MKSFVTNLVSPSKIVSNLEDEETSINTFSILVIFSVFLSLIYTQRNVAFDLQNEVSFFSVLIYTVVSFLGTALYVVMYSQLLFWSFEAKTSNVSTTSIVKVICNSLIPYVVAFPVLYYLIGTPNGWLLLLVAIFWSKYLQVRMLKNLLETSYIRSFSLVLLSTFVVNLPSIMIIIYLF